MDTLIEQTPNTNAPEPAPHETRALVADPLFLLAPPRSFTAVAGTMLGQHPQTYGLPETHLFGCATMAEWWGACEEQTFPRAHGLLRVVAELFCGGQTQATIRQAAGWLRRRSHFTTGMLMETLPARGHPRLVVHNKPSVGCRPQILQRMPDP